MFCPNCGNQMPDGVKFCSNCGKSVTDVAALQTNAMPPQSGVNAAVQPKVPVQPKENAVATQPKKEKSGGKKKTWIPIVIVLAILLLCGGAAGWYLNANSPAKKYEATMSKGQEYLDNKKYKDAIKTFLEAKKYHVSEEELEEQLFDAYVEYAKKLYKDGDYEEALEQYKKAQEIDEDNKKVNNAIEELNWILSQGTPSVGGEPSQAAADPSSSSGEPSEPSSSSGEPSEPSQSVTEPSSGGEPGGNGAYAGNNDGKVLNIYCWNEEFISRLADHYPGYQRYDATTGKIGDVTVQFTVIPTDDNYYQQKLDAALLRQKDAAADDKIDLFLVEADYALKYVDTDYAMKLSDLGITSSDLADQYSYTQEIVKDGNGNLKASCWQACAGGMIYNRSMAKEILGTDDPDQVQQAVSSWDKFFETASKVAAAGYVMCSANDTYRVYSNNVTGKWVQNNTIVVDPNLKKWVEDSKNLVAYGAENTNDLWSAEWAKGKYPDGNTFCFFGPAWFFNFCLDYYDSASIAGKGGWGFCVGPQSYYWGGTWICAATGTDNEALVRDVILTMTADKKVLKEIAIWDSDCVNSRSVLAELANSYEGNLAILGGQNPYKMLAAGAEKIDLSNISKYDQTCNEEFQKAMANYIKGNTSYEDALWQFEKAVKAKHPELSY